MYYANAFHINYNRVDYTNNWLGSANDKIRSSKLHQDPRVSLKLESL